MPTKINLPQHDVAVQPNDLHTFLKSSHRLSLKDRTLGFYHFIKDLKRNHQYTYKRKIISPTNRIVTIWDDYSHKKQEMLMFASNNYLGLANHPYVVQKVKEAIARYGVGIGGPPLLNGYSSLMAELEERIAAFKHQDAAMIFPSGYSTNLGLLAGLTNENDVILFDKYSHASFYDGMEQTKARTYSFHHNDIKDLEEKLKEVSTNIAGNIYVGIEGVYSMDGDISPLDKMVPLLKKYRAVCLLDDAHGTGVLGATGSGTAEHLGVSKEIDISMGTFSKTFAVTGGFLAASKEIINYLNFFARPYMFSASLPPVSLAAILAGIDVIEKEPWLRIKLEELRVYAIEKLKKFGFFQYPEAGIIALKIPENMNIRKANYEIHRRGIFLNAIEYPAVEKRKERFRISLIAKHRKEDIDYLAQVVEEVYADPSNYLA